MAAPKTTEERIEHIAEMMRNLEWRRGKSLKALACEWGISPSTVGNYSAEASRRVRKEVQDPEEVGRTVCTALDKTIRLAVRDDDRRSIVQAAKVWSDIAGAGAAQRLDITHGANEATPAAAREIMNQLFGGNAAPDAEPGSGEDEAAAGDGAPTE